MVTRRQRIDIMLRDSELNVLAAEVLSITAVVKLGCFTSADEVYELAAEGAFPIRQLGDRDIVLRREWSEFLASLPVWRPNAANSATADAA
jgi:hypothetical protein